MQCPFYTHRRRGVNVCKRWYSWRKRADGLSTHGANEKCAFDKLLLQDADCSPKRYGSDWGNLIPPHQPLKPIFWRYSKVTQSYIYMPLLKCPILSAAWQGYGAWEIHHVPHDEVHKLDHKSEAVITWNMFKKPERFHEEGNVIYIMESAPSNIGTYSNHGQSLMAESSGI